MNDLNNPTGEVLKKKEEFNGRRKTLDLNEFPKSKGILEVNEENDNENILNENTSLIANDAQD